MNLFLVIVVLPAWLVLTDVLMIFLPIVVDVDHLNAYLEAKGVVPATLLKEHTG